MNYNLYIKEVKQEKTTKGVDISFLIQIKEKEYLLKYVVTADVTELCDRADGVVVTFLLYAMKYGMNIYSDIPISEKLYYQLTYHVIPQIHYCNPDKTTPIKIIAPLSDEVYNGNWVGTGISCGVDSFSTIKEYTEDCELANYKITHLCYFKTGAHHGDIGRFDKQIEDKLFAEELEKAKEFCEKENFEMVIVESNLHEICCDAFSHVYDITHTYRSAGVMLLLQKQFNKYYYASGDHNVDEVIVNVDNDSAKYEKWLLPLLSNESIAFYSANKATKRIEKVEYISNWAPTYDRLSVCWSASNNCCKCRKCIRTMVALDLVGKLDCYSQSFDLEFYQKNKRKFMREIVALRSIDCSYQDIYLYMKKHHIKMPNPLMVFVVKVKFILKTVFKLGFKEFFARLRTKF